MTRPLNIGNGVSSSSTKARSTANADSTSLNSAHPSATTKPMRQAGIAPSTCTGSAPSSSTPKANPQGSTPLGNKPQPPKAAPQAHPQAHQKDPPPAPGRARSGRSEPHHLEQHAQADARPDAHRPTEPMPDRPGPLDCKLQQDGLATQSSPALACPGADQPGLPSGDLLQLHQDLGASIGRSPGGGQNAGPNAQAVRHAPPSLFFGSARREAAACAR